MLKRILIGFFGAIILLLLIGFAFPAKLDVSQSISVDAPPSYVFEEVNDLKNWSRWSYWQANDSTMKFTYGTPSAGANANYSWTSAEGPGSLNITENIPDKSIKFNLLFMEDGSPATGWYLFEQEGSGTKVSTGFQYDHGFNPLSRWFGKFMLEPEMKKAFNHDLGRLKELAEAKAKSRVSITEEILSAIFYVGLSSKMDSQDQVAISAQMAKHFTELHSVLEKANIPTSGYPFCLFPAYSEQSLEMICALQVPSEIKLPAKYKVVPTEGGRVVKATHFGDYGKLKETHEQVLVYIGSHKLEIKGAPWEAYVTDPSSVKDTAQWLTEVYYPVKD